MKSIWNNDETTSTEWQMLYWLSKDLLHAVLPYHSMTECSLRPSLLWTVIYSPSSKSHASWKNSQTYSMLLLLKQRQCCIKAGICFARATEYVCPQRKWHFVAEVEWAGLTQKTIGNKRCIGMPTVFRDLAAAELYYLLSVLFSKNILSKLTHPKGVTWETWGTTCCALS